MMKNILVAIKCTAYNHGPYIRECLEGFVQQKTDFHFVAIVHDDASTDNTAEIIREYAEKYPEIIKPIYQTENQYSKHNGSLRRIMNEAVYATECKYTAICEGDDFWTDPLKLQKQVDFLEANPGYSMCCSNIIRMEHSTGKKWGKIYKNRIITLNEIMYQRNRIPTLTSLMRTELMKEYTDLCNGFPKWPVGDTPMWLWMASKGNIYKLPDVTAVYRILEESASHTKNKDKTFFFRMASFEIRLFFCNLLHKNSLPIWIDREFFIIKDVLRNFSVHKNKIKYLTKTVWPIKPQK